MSQGQIQPHLVTYDRLHNPADRLWQGSNMRVGLILLLLLVAAYRTQLGNGGQDDQEEVFCKVHCHQQE